MRLLAASLALMLCLTVPLAGSPRADYFTEDELDLIRDAQGLDLRLPAYIKLAEKRLVILGVSEKSEKEKEKELKQQEQYEKERKKAGVKADQVKPPVDEYDYLREYTRSELLRGYVQVLDEVMTNLEDSYSRKLDVRNALEDFEKFTSETLLKIEKFQPKTPAETLAWEAAVEKGKEALAGAKEALTIVPKTEQRRK